MTAARSSFSSSMPLADGAGSTRSFACFSKLRDVWSEHGLRRWVLHAWWSGVSIARTASILVLAASSRDSAQSVFHTLSTVHREMVRVRLPAAAIGHNRSCSVLVRPKWNMPAVGIRSEAAEAVNSRFAVWAMALGRARARAASWSVKSQVVLHVCERRSVAAACVGGRSACAAPAASGQQVRSKPRSAYESGRKRRTLIRSCGGTARSLDSPIGGLGSLYAICVFLSGVVGSS